MHRARTDASGHRLPGIRRCRSARPLSPDGLARACALRCRPRQPSGSGASCLASRQPGAAANIEHLVSGTDPVSGAKVLVLRAQLSVVEVRAVRRGHPHDAIDHGSTSAVPSSDAIRAPSALSVPTTTVRRGVPDQRSRGLRAPALTFRPPVERRSGYSNENPQGELAADGHARRIFSIGFPFASSSTSLSRRRIFGMRGSHCGRG
jgi:hypothetical protein